MRVPKVFDLRADPFERGEDGVGYSSWFFEQIPLMYLSQAVFAKWLSSFKEFPPRARSASFSLDQIVEKLMPKD
jgi:arylsulfatase